MRLRILLFLCTLQLGSFSGLTQNPVYDLNAKPETAEIMILATSTSIHQNFAGNYEVYLGEISLKNGARKLVKLVDIYPSSALPIRNALLMENRRFRMKLRRDPECNVVARAFFLGNESSIFDANAPEVLKEHAADVIPCYRVDHDATRLTK